MSPEDYWGGKIMKRVYLCVFCVVIMLSLAACSVQTSQEQELNDAVSDSLSEIYDAADAIDSMNAPD